MGRPVNGYELDGETVPGVTTIVGRGKSSAGLMQWVGKQNQRMAEAALRRNLRSVLIPQIAAGNDSLIAQLNDFLGRDVDPNEFDPNRIRDFGAEVGTALHEMVEHYLLHGKSKTYADGEVLLAAIECMKAWHKWREQMPGMQVIGLEIAMVSRQYRYGGTCDAVITAGDGTIWLCDWKSSNNVYEDAIVQCVAYAQLLRETRAINVERIAIVNANKAGGLKWWLFDIEEVYETAWQTFLAGLTLYRNDAKLARMMRQNVQ